MDYRITVAFVEFSPKRTGGFMAELPVNSLGFRPCVKNTRSTDLQWKSPTVSAPVSTGTCVCSASDVDADPADEEGYEADQITPA